MIKIENIEVFGVESAIRGMRNPMNSWDKSDSYWGLVEDPSPVNPNDEPFFFIGENDLGLMKRLSKAGNDHAKFLRMIHIQCDVTAPLYWWKEFDTYKVGTVANGTSTMHKIQAKEFVLDDFSCEHLTRLKSERLHDDKTTNFDYIEPLNMTITALNVARKMFLKTNDKQYWWQMIQLLPSSYNQLRTVDLNYQVLKSAYWARKDHKLDEWRNFCEWCLTLPYFYEICVKPFIEKEK